jgi:iron complex transport system ATP-binding protein
VSLLHLAQVDAGYGGATVLRELDLTIEPGQAWVVLGPNGAGKSTLVRVVMGLVTPARGTVTLDGVRLPQPPQVLARKVAWVPQSTAEDTAFTGLEVALMGAAPRLGPWGVPSSTELELARAALAELDVLHLAHRPLTEVSGGERRRVWLARALVQQAPLLVLDEPTAFLDVRHQVETLAAVRARLGRGLGVLAVLHDVNLAAHLATHVLLLKQGRVLAKGERREVLTAARLSELYDLPMHAATLDDGLFAPRAAT